MERFLCVFLFYGLARRSSKQEAAIRDVLTYLAEEIHHAHQHGKGSGQSGSRETCLTRLTQHFPDLVTAGPFPVLPAQLRGNTVQQNSLWGLVFFFFFLLFTFSLGIGFRRQPTGVVVGRGQRKSSP